MPNILTKDMLTEICNKAGTSLDNFNTFIESGTATGWTIDRMQPLFKMLHTIEVSEKYYKMYVDKNNHDNVISHLGDSGVVMGQIMKMVKEDEQCIFWLDGHYSSGDTGKGVKDCPLLEECRTIDKSYKPNSAILIIDDYRLFGTNITEDWSEITVENILPCFKTHKIGLLFVHDDALIIQIYK